VYLHLVEEVGLAVLAAEQLKVTTRDKSL
jgi:hypothetical protein